MTVESPWTHGIFLAILSLRLCENHYHTICFSSMILQHIAFLNASFGSEYTNYMPFDRDRRLNFL